MGEAFITRRQKVKNRAIIRVKTAPNATIACGDGVSNYKSVSDSSGMVDFPVQYGTWTLTKYNSDNTTTTKSIVIDALKIYNIELFSGIFGVRIDQSIPDPTDAVTYTDDAEGMEPLSVNLTTGECNYGGWKNVISEVFGARPCLVSNGTVYKYLDPNDYTKAEDGSSVTITGGNYDVMVEFKRTWYKWEEDGDILTFRVSDHEITNYKSHAFASMLSSDGSISDPKGSVIKEYMYYGAYEAYLLSSRLRSLSNKTPSVYDKTVSCTKDTMNTVRSYATNNDALYSGIEDYYKYNYILSLLLLITKSRDLPSKLGYGVYRSGNNASEIVNTGTLNNKGLFCGFKQSEKKSVKCFGIENLWGNIFRYCDGVYTSPDPASVNANKILLRSSPPFYNLNGGSFIPVVSEVERNQILYVSSMTVDGQNVSIFPKISQSDSSIGWTSNVYIKKQTDICGAIISTYGNICGPWGIDVVVGSNDTSICDNVGARITMSSKT